MSISPYKCLFNVDIPWTVTLNFRTKDSIGFLQNHENMTHVLNQIQRNSNIREILISTKKHHFRYVRLTREELEYLFEECPFLRGMKPSGIFKDHSKDKNSYWIEQNDGINVTNIWTQKAFIARFGYI